MPTELEEVSQSRKKHCCFTTNFAHQLVGFIGHENPQIRLLSTENLVPYSLSEPTIFKAEDLTPVKNLKFLISDHPVSSPSLNVQLGQF